MSAQEGVLAVMDSYSRVFQPNEGRDGADMAAARELVAELIEAVKENRAATEEFARDGQPANWGRYDASERRLLLALARAQGAA